MKIPLDNNATIVYNATLQNSPNKVEMKNDYIGTIN